MKSLFRALLCLTLLAALAGGYAVWGTDIAVESIAVQTVPAAEQPQQYARWQQRLAQDAVPGTVYDESALLPMEDAAFMVYTVRLANRGLLPMEMIELQVSPERGDVLAVPGEVSMGGEAPRGLALAPFARGAAQAVVLTGAAVSPRRTITVTYYVWGHPFTVRRPAY